MEYADAVTELVLETFRLNGRLLAAGDELIADLQLTSARWQVLGAIALSRSSMPVAHVARVMGLTRQAVQRLANDMAGDGLIDFAENPHHRRAKLLILTDKGRKAYDRAIVRQVPWAEALGDGLSVDRIKAAAAVMKRIRLRLETQRKTKEDSDE